jgi:hypothetical protein
MVALLCARDFSLLLGTAFNQMFVPCGASVFRGLLRAAFTGFARGAATSSPRSRGRRCATSPDGFRLLVPRLLLSWSFGLWLCFTAVAGLVLSQPVFWLFWIICHLLRQVAPLPLMLCINRCPAVEMFGFGIVGWLVWLFAVCLLSIVLCSLLCQVAPLLQMLSIFRCPMIEYLVHMFVGSSDSLGVRLFGDRGPYGGSVRLCVGVLLSGGYAVV